MLPSLGLAALVITALAVATLRAMRRTAAARAEARRWEDRHDRLAAVLDGMDAAVFAVDAEERVTALNLTMRKLFDLDERAVGQSFREVVPVDKIHDSVEEAMRGRSVRAELETPGESRRHVVAYASPIGHAEGVAVVLRDVTAIRHLERVRRDFVANVSHELGTPVTVIRTSAETLLDGALDDPEHARAFAHAIERHASRMTRIISSLLELARLEAGQRGLAREKVNARAAALRAADLVGDLAAERGVRVTVEVDVDHHFLADTKGVDQVLSNLVHNAVKYGSEGGQIEVRSQAGEGWVRVEVADDGPGLKAKHRQRVWERFYRVDKGRSRERGGTGLGLAIVKHLILAMGGTVGVDPRSPSGSVFWVRLPTYIPTPPSGLRNLVSDDESARASEKGERGRPESAPPGSRSGG